MACGRMASRSYEVISQRSAPFAAKTLKWLYQKSTISSFELALAVDRARHLRHGKLGDDSLRRMNLRVVEHRVAEAALALSLHLCLSLDSRPNPYFQILPESGRSSDLRSPSVGAIRLHGSLHARLLLFAVFLEGNALAPRGDLRLGKFVERASRRTS